VTIHLNVLIENLGDLPGGIALRPSAGGLELHPAVLEAVGGWVMYKVHTVDDERREVAGRSSVSIPARVTFEVAGDGESWSTMRDRAVGRARLGRAFAEFLLDPIAGVKIDVITDDKEMASHYLTVQGENPGKRFAINALDIDQLETSLHAIDEAVREDPNRFLPYGELPAAYRRVFELRDLQGFHQDAVTQAGCEITEDDRRWLGETADLLLESAPEDAVGSRRTITELREMCRDDNVPAGPVVQQVEAVLASFGWE
jgi:hypothetical protein